MRRFKLYIELLTIMLAFMFCIGTATLATVSTTTFSNTYTASGSTTAFTFNFPVINSSVVVVEVNGVVQSSGYTVTLNQTTPGGTVTFGTAPVASSTVLITRVTPLTQTSALSNEGVLPAATLESMSDKLTMIAQEIDAMVSQVGGGTVTSVAATGDNVLYNPTVTGSPITVGGTLVPVLKTQNPNSIFGNFTNGSAVPGWLQGVTNGTFLGMQSGVLGMYTPPLSSGTVTSAGFTGDGVVYNSSVPGSPITSSGAFAPTLVSQAANTVFCNPTAGVARPTWLQGTANGTFLGMQGGVLGMYTPPSVSGGTVSNVSTVGTPAWLTSTWANSSTTPAQTIGVASGQTANQFLATPDGTTGAVGLRSMVAGDIPPINLASTANGGVTSTLPIAQGGTNNASLGVSAGGIYYGNGTQLTQLAPGTGLLQCNGTSAPTIVSGGSLSSVTVTISSAQIDAISTTPVQLVAAQGSGVAIVPTSVLVKYLYGGTAYTAGNTLAAQYGNTGGGGGTPVTNSVAVATMRGTSSIDIQLVPLVGTNGIVVQENTGLFLASNAINFATGNGTLQVTTFYSTK